MNINDALRAHHAHGPDCDCTPALIGLYDATVAGLGELGRLLPKAARLYGDIEKQLADDVEAWLREETA